MVVGNQFLEEERGKVVGQGGKHEVDKFVV
jgi:hypothetical protein